MLRCFLPHRPVTSAIALLLVATSASCTQKTALYCDANTPCDDPLRPFCDVDGEHPASDFIAGTCIPTPESAAADASVGDATRPDASTQPHPIDVLYIAPTTNTDRALYRAQISDNQVTGIELLSGPHITGLAGIRTCFPTPDGSRIVYLAEQSSPSIDELYVVDLDGTSRGSRSRVSLGSSVSFTALSANGRRLIFREDPADDGNYELYAVDLHSESPEAVGLGPVVAPSDREFVATVSDDGDHVAFKGKYDAIYYVYLGDGAPTAAQRVNPAPTHGVRDFYFAPDSRSLLYVAADAQQDVFDLYLSPLLNGEAGSPVRVNLPHPDNGTIGSSTTAFFYRSVFFTADATQVVYRVEHGTAGATYFVADIRGPSPGQPRQLNGASISGEAYDEWSVSPGRPGFAYLNDQLQEERRELWFSDLSDPAATSPAIHAEAPFAMLGDVESATFSDDGEWLVYMADSRAPGVHELFATRVSSGTPGDFRRLSGDIATGGDVVDFTPGGLSFIRGSQAVLYLADQDLDEAVELYVVGLGASAPSQKVHPDLAAGDAVEAVSVSSDGSAVLFRATIGGNTDLWFVPVEDGSPRAPAQVNPTLAPGEKIGEFWVVP